MLSLISEPVIKSTSWRCPHSCHYCDILEHYRLSEKQDVLSISLQHHNLPRDLGKVICRNSAELLTEKECEYKVEIIKTIHEKYLLLQFNITNNFVGQIIKNCHVDIDYDESNMYYITCPLIKYGKCGITLAVIKRDDTNPYIINSFESKLKFLVNTKYEEYEDEYVLNDINVHYYDYIHSINNEENFKQIWSCIGKTNEVRKKGILVSDNLQFAVKTIIKKSGLIPIGESNKIKNENVIDHILNLIGYSDKNEPIIMRVYLMLNNDKMSFKVAVRCANKILQTSCLQSI